MAGYTPLFSNLTTGTLCGRWPDIGLWPIILSMADKNGVVDVTPAYIAGVTGLDIEAVVECMARFCAPDHGSRSDAEGGARLVLLDAHRDWGWHIVNHGQYREKARLAAKNADAVASGREAERKRHTRGSTNCPPVSAGVRRDPPVSDPSDADADSDKKNTEGAAARPARAKAKAKAEPPEFAVIRFTYPRRAGSQRWQDALERCQALVAEGTPWTDLIAAAERYARFCEATGKVGTETTMQAASFYGKNQCWREDYAAPPKPGNGRRERPPTPAEIATSRREARAVNEATMCRLGLTGGAALKAMPGS